MTDEDLIARLRSQIGDDVQHMYDHEALFRISADRIEQLAKELHTSRMASVIMDNTVAEAEAKLAKAVEVLRHSRAACLEAWGSHGAIHIDALLAELKKEV